LTAQQPLNNVVRTSYQALAAVLGGTQSLHTNAYDEALGLPTEASATVALRTQQILAFESGVADTVDPLAGSYYVEALTDAVEREALGLIDEIGALGGAVVAIEQGFQQRLIEEAAYQTARQIESDQQVVVGVNRYATAAETSAPLMSVDPRLESGQVASLAEVRSGRDQGAVDRALSGVVATARSDGNLLYPMKDALAAGATLGEVSTAIGEVFGAHPS
jgi:methylmalonyl-CoA mutase N-terminal domain/subunit